ncbi:hypothetical protein ASPZODRAFT_130477 [Penicilliopsis zonata CBS 506.65]|uniref:tRNA (adenine(58)-N(1))-methyltransferase catalytic subunit TRM61 n=1 Tax=Penicilliopsis zonata CBS 506.65 TaxID=1073090 RepID=A0A1L9SML6_9EURO|nr:hypothetical protein ASPZODRAFT_130477 [Penicilliopsis zonata CBS 506.65]OJJ48450.1 hypothetical protein ASPZODRAFT_130477 [Penicilliopsis zonata CBS 506.65]
MPSPFFTPGTRSQADQVALLHLRRDQTIPTVLQIHDDKNLGYDEGKVTNTRFGSFPHSTLLGQPWGSQIAASKVDTGSRGRRPPTQTQTSTPTETQTQTQLKRKAEDSPTVTDDARPTPKAAVAAASGYLHLLYPTPESWTASLPHRTQVVYTPDYSYILHRLRARPGCTILEAGAGSGSFTHAAARAVFNGYPSSEESLDEDQQQQQPSKKRRLGKVCSFEFHAQRVERVRDELVQHGLQGVVHATHRDVYGDGFLLDGASPHANAIFLDLPAPWLALKHLTRRPVEGGNPVSPLDPSTPVYICTFSPCLEQAQKTISTLRQLGWVAIEMVEVQHRRLEIRRERYGLDARGVRGAVVFPKSVDEAIGKLRASDRGGRFRNHKDDSIDTETPPAVNTTTITANTTTTTTTTITTQNTPVYNLGRVVHRTEADLKTHTSYLVFAVLPREWSEADEAKCRAKWPSSCVVDSKPFPAKSKKQLKREEKAKRDEERRKNE